jgi:hypothetical protein
LADDDHPQYLNAARHDADDHSGLTESIEFTELGTLVAKNGTVRWYPPYAITVVDAVAMVSVAPTGGPIEVDVNKNGVTIFTTQTNRPIIAAAGFRDVSGAPNVTSLLETDYITIDIDLVGVTVAGDDLVVQIRYTRA